MAEIIPDNRERSRNTLDKAENEIQDTDQSAE